VRLITVGGLVVTDVPWYIITAAFIDVLIRDDSRRTSFSKNVVIYRSADV